MMTLVWCDRVKYRVLGSRGEVADDIENARNEGYYFIFLDTDYDGNQACLAIDKISSLEKIRHE